MKRVYRNLIFLSLSLLVCMFLAVPANAQHRGNGNHGGGGNRGGGGGGGGRSYSAGGGGRSYSAGRSYSGGGRTAYSAGRSYSGTRGNVGNRAYVNRAGAGRSYAGARGGVNAYRRGGYGGRAYVGGRGYAGARGYGRGYYGRGYGRGYYGGYRGYGWGGRFGYGGFYRYGGFYNSIYWPRLGFRVGFLPYGYYPFYWGGLQYYYSDGYYYNYDNNQYTVVEPPVGAQLNTLPAGAKPITINGQQYYELDGIYYVAVTKDDGSLAYEIAGKDGELNTDGGGDQGQDQGQYDQAPPAGNGQGYNNAPAPQQQEEQPEQQERPERNGSADLQVGDLVQSLPKDSRGVTVNGQRLFVSPDDVYYKKTLDKDGNVAYKIVGLPSDAPDNN